MPNFNFCGHLANLIDMTILILIFLLTVATYLGLIGQQKTCVALYAVSLCLFLLVGFGWLPARLLDNLQTAYLVAKPEKWGQHNAIILLGAGLEKVSAKEYKSFEAGTFANARLIKAAALYRACKQHSSSCKIILSGGDPLHVGASEAMVYQSLLLELGIASTDLVVEPHSLNTWQNAQYTKALLTPLDADHIWLVTSAQHMRRSMLYFSHFGIQAQPERADYLKAHHTLMHSSWNFVLTDLALKEYIGIARYYIYNQLGLNVPTTSI